MSFPEPTEENDLETNYGISITPSSSWIVEWMIDSNGRAIQRKQRIPLREYLKILFETIPMLGTGILLLYYNTSYPPSYPQIYWIQFIAGLILCLVTITNILERIFTKRYKLWGILNYSEFSWLIVFYPFMLSLIIWTTIF